ncbi:MAG: amino acid permease [Candidatus Dadabacteria bacterium]|nr:amino acid permease [Candidatus Dadabacteria bacterium]NIS07330.1 amino acid permease [Candidatus Dadabacteria bacterium]NIV41274.1 amino acid permease [Candidatus Dadabacteria bacterium]NIX14509.1 amino acid permease [Candidatus Dadabacteria bacterium]NIY20967.1 amino acid permease [Candidatus Dadabacteria bacterium]
MKDSNAIGAAKLNRSIPLWLITFYGIGTILGAGIYVLIAEISSVSGNFTPFSFLLSAVIVTFSAFSYSELSSRYPRSAGEAAYVQEAFSAKWLSSVAGWAIVIIGIVSSATIAKGFVGYFQVFFYLPDWLCIIFLISMLCLISIWGVSFSLKAAAVMTVVEIIGIVLVIYFCGSNLTSIKTNITEFIPSSDIKTWSNIFVGAFIAFYAYVGFEDIVNMAEEVKNPRKNLPIAIIIALVVTTVLYIIVSLVTVTSLPADVLSNTRSPFTTLIELNSNFPISIITIISIMAIVNGALIQIIMGSRVLYGMASQKISPNFFGHINKHTRTPDYATIFVGFVVLALALWFPLVTLAKASSLIILLVFMLINLSLFIIKVRRKEEEQSYIRLPVIIPVLGFALCLFLLMAQFVNKLKG